MKTTTEKAAEALELLPEEMREPAVAYLIEQAEKFRVLKEQIADGLEDAAAGRVSKWDFEEFLRQARNKKQIVPGDGTCS
jgi:predicted transcriptional regulator